VQPPGHRIRIGAEHCDRVLLSVAPTRQCLLQRPGFTGCKAGTDPLPVLGAAALGKVAVRLPSKHQADERAQHDAERHCHGEGHTQFSAPRALSLGALPLWRFDEH